MNSSKLIEFFSYGHENILANHKNSFEFTKDKNLSLDGDCIVGVKSDFSEIGFDVKDKESTKFGFDESVYTKIKVTIECEGLSDKILGYYNTDFDSDGSIVFRKSKEKDKRTFAFYCDKGAVDIDRELVEKLKSPHTKMIVRIEVLD